MRRPRLSDSEAIFEYGSDPEVAYYADWPICTSIDSIVESLGVRTASWENGEEFYWVITLVEDDRAIGGVSCRIIHNSAEIGFLLNRCYWGNGLATEASSAVIKWGFSLASVLKVWATCDTENLSSIRVLEKVGLSREASLHQGIIRPNISNKPRDAFIYSRAIPAA